VTCRGNNRRTIFHDQSDFKALLNISIYYKGKLQFQLYNYALMPNHLHFLIKTSNHFQLPEIMKRMKHKYSMYHKVKYGRTGPLWEGRYRSKLMKTDMHWAACGPYIEMNPVRAGLVSRPERWKWSSYKANALLEPNELVNLNPFYFEHGDIRRNAREYRRIVEARCQAPY
jgi:putative transposase